MSNPIEFHCYSCLRTLTVAKPYREEIFLSLYQEVVSAELWLVVEGSFCPSCSIFIRCTNDKITPYLVANLPGRNFSCSLFLLCL